MAGEIEMMDAKTENNKEIDKQMNSSEIQNQISLESDQKSGEQPISNPSTCETMEGEVEYVVGDNAGEGDDDDIEGEGEEEIITSAMPPTQIVDTIVTTTTNPDGSLKRTTRKTTRTVLTTARIRKIKVKNLPSDGESTKSSSMSTNNDLNMSNVINFTKLNSEKSEGKSLAQATLAIIPPQTEVTYQENVKSISDIDADTAAKLQQSTSNENSSDNVTPQKAITKTTMKKTVSATAATATFYATGKDAMSPRLFTTTGATNEMLFNSCNSSPLLSTNDGNKGLTKSTIKIAAFKRTSNTSPTKRKARDSLTTSASTTTTTTTTTLGASSTTTTTTTRKQTTRVMNNFASKGFFFTFKKPFGFFGREIRGDIEDNQNNASIGSNNTDIVDTEQLALLTMKESERLFSQAKLMFPSNQNLSSDVTIQSSSSGKNEDGLVQGYQSRFANLPLYQGYGIIAHQMALSNKVKTTKRTDGDSGIKHQDDEEDKKKSVDVISDTVDIKQQVTDQTGADMSLVANAFAHLLDESILKFLCEATSQQLGRSGPLNLFELPAYIEGLPQNKQLVYSDSTDEGIAQPGDNFNKSLALPSTEQFDDKTDEKIKEGEQNRPQQLTDSTGTQIGQTLGQKTSRFGGGSQGAFRVAWSEMPEVVESNCLQRLTRHEIQLQEAMFEVITSEASYYQSLNVLVNHFYHAPEFECEPLSHTSSFQSNQPPSKMFKEPGSPLPGQPDLANNQTTVDMNTPPTNATTTTPGSGMTTNNNNNNVSNATTPTCTTATTNTCGNNVGSTDTCVDAGNQTPASSNTRRPLLKPLEKHHLFSNVLLVCLASEMFLRDLEARWEARMPILNEVCDLIVKHAGGVNFEPYITYLRNQTYQMDTLRTLCQRESFREALERLHSHPRSGKNLITSFLALPMQRLTRLKLLVEVIRRLQDAVIRDSMDKTLEKRPFRVPSDRERENVQLALRELNRLLTASETEKELMDRKSRLLTLSSSLEFPDNVKRIAISDKRLIKEGELRECLSDSGRLSVLQKLAIRKPNIFYLILFNDLLLVTRKKKNERFQVLDYCDRASVQAFVQRNGDLIGTSTNLLKNPKNSISAEPLCIIEPCLDDLRVSTRKTKHHLSPDTDDAGSNVKHSSKDKRHRRYKTTTEFENLKASNNDSAISTDNYQRDSSRVQSDIITSEVNVENNEDETTSLPASPAAATTVTDTDNTITVIATTAAATTAITAVSPVSPAVSTNTVTSTKKINLSRSGSSLSGYHLRFNHERIRNIKSTIFSTSQPSANALVTCKTGTIHLKLLGSHNGTCMELILLPKDNREFESWCKAFSVSLDSPY